MQRRLVNCFMLPFYFYFFRFFKFCKIIKKKTSAFASMAPTSQSTSRSAAASRNRPEVPSSFAGKSKSPVRGEPNGSFKIVCGSGHFCRNTPWTGLHSRHTRSHLGEIWSLQSAPLALSARDPDMLLTGFPDAR